MQNNSKWQERIPFIHKRTSEWASDKQIAKELGIHPKGIWELKKRIEYNLFSKALEDNNFDPHNWSNGWLKGSKDENGMSVSIHLKNDMHLTKYEDIRDEMIEEMKKYAPKYPELNREPIKDWHLLIIDCADIHIWKLAMSDETGNDYNIDIAESRCIEAVNSILHKAQGFEIEKILFVIGNDVLHIDHPHWHTTANTPQDTDRQWWYMFKRAKQLYIKLIETLITHADVDIVFNPSNHDYTSGFYLADTIGSWFSQNSHVSFDIDIKHRKYYTYWKNLLGTTHWDGAKEQDLVYLMANEAKDWSTTEYRYWYLHHIHHHKKIKYQSWKDYIGCTLEYLRSPSEADGWHDRNWYVGAKKAIEGFIHHKEDGQVAKIIHNF